MHLCLASAGSGHRLRRLQLVLCLLAAGCAPREGPPDFRLVWTVDPDPPAVGPARLSLTLTHASDARPVTGARVRLEGNMTHPGMVPVWAEAHEIAPGRYQAELALTMRGDWIVTVEATPTSGGVFREDFPLRVTAAEPAPTVGRSVPNPGRSLPEVGDLVPGLGRSVPSLGEVVPGVGRSVPNPGEVMPGAGRSLPKAGPSAPKAGEPVPNAPSAGGYASVSARSRG